MTSSILLLALGLTVPGLAGTPSSLDVDAYQAEPVRTRAGTLKFTDPALANPSVAPIFLERLDGDESSTMRQALVVALPRTGGDWSEGLLERLAIESDPDVRIVMVEVLRQADDDSARAGLVLGAQDTSTAVRTATMRTAAYVGQRVDLDSLVLTAMADESSEVRAAAARTGGYLKLTSAWDVLVPQLEDADDEVRLQALRALERIDPTSTAALPMIDALCTDRDARVVRTAIALRENR